MLHTNKLLRVKYYEYIHILLLTHILDAKHGAGAAGGARTGTKEAVLDALTRKTGMSMEEACQILNVTKEADISKLTKVMTQEEHKRKKRSFDSGILEIRKFFKIQ